MRPHPAPRIVWSRHVPTSPHSMPVSAAADWRSQARAATARLARPPTEAMRLPAQLESVCARWASLRTELRLDVRAMGVVVADEEQLDRLVQSLPASPGGQVGWSSCSSVRTIDGEASKIADDDRAFSRVGLHDRAPAGFRVYVPLSHRPGRPDRDATRGSLICYSRIDPRGVGW